MPSAADLRERMAAARQRYAAKHSADEPLPDPEAIAAHVMLPAYLEARTAPIPDGPTRQDRWRRDVTECMANRSGAKPGEPRLAEKV